MFEKGTRGGWKKYEGNPVLGGDLGTCFDISVLEENGKIRLYFSWRPQKSVAVAESEDGIHFSAPEICIAPIKREDGWEDELNRPGVLKKDGIYHMWYTGQYLPGKKEGNSYIFYAVSEDGVHFTRVQTDPVLLPEEPWEDAAVMCPDVIWDEEEKIYKMWYSGGEQYEPNAIGYAESSDGIHWKKYAGNPVFASDPAHEWEQHKVTACQVMKRENDYFMFYIGFHDEDYAQIGMARSKDGITDWERSKLNPIIAPDPEGFDASACYKPFAVWRDGRWMLYYNGRNGSKEQIALVTNDEYDFDF